MNLFQRNKQHCDSLGRKSHNSVLYIHLEEVHPEKAKEGTFRDFEFLPGVKYKGPLQRQVGEAQELLQFVKEKERNSKLGIQPIHIFNSKSEFNQPCGFTRTKTVKIWGDARF